VSPPSSEQDNEKLLLRIKEQIGHVGIELPTVKVCFEHLCVEAELHVGECVLPTIFNFTRDFVKDMLASCQILPSNKRPLNILKDISEVIKPRIMTLLLGPPCEYYGRLIFFACWFWNRFS
jgi:hypothetical protein